MVFLKVSVHKNIKLMEQFRVLPPLPKINMISWSITNLKKNSHDFDHDYTFASFFFES